MENFASTLKVMETNEVDKQCDAVINAGVRKLKRMRRQGGIQTFDDALLYNRLFDYVNRALLAELFEVRYYEKDIKTIARGSRD
jgi:hypothetical protein